jgi:hypothetical protein
MLEIHGERSWKGSRIMKDAKEQMVKSMGA